MAAAVGADAARTPFWSPDSRFIGFFGDGALKVIPATGGPARELCSETGSGQGGTWNPSGVILFGSDGGGPLRRVDASGGTCAVVGKDDLGSSARLPVFLPDGNHFFYVGVKRAIPLHAVFIWPRWTISHRARSWRTIRVWSTRRRWPAGARICCFCATPR